MACKIRAEHNLYSSTPVANSTASKVGEFTGGLLLFSVVPGGIAARGYKLALSGAASGAVVTGLQPVYEGNLTQRGINSLVGATTGAILAPTMAKAFEVSGQAIVRLYARKAAVAKSLELQPQRLTKGQLIDYLQNVDKVPLEQLISALRRDKINFKLLHIDHQEKIYKFCHVKNDLRIYDTKNPNANLYKVDVKAKANLKSSKFMVEIHCDKASGPHMHIKDTHGNVYDKHLNNLTAKIRKDNPGWHEKKLKDKIERLPEAHIHIKEFVNLNLRLDNV